VTSSQRDAVLVDLEETCLRVSFFCCRFGCCLDDTRRSAGREDPVAGGGVVTSAGNTGSRNVGSILRVDWLSSLTVSSTGTL
jgi:hypothetical protein